MIKVKLENKIMEYNDGISLMEIAGNNYNTVAALVDNQLVDLRTTLIDDCQVSFVSLDDEIGNRIYRRSLFLVLVEAVYKLFPGSKLSIEHSLSNGIYCELHKGNPLSQRDLFRIKKKMKDIINSDLPITKEELPINKAIQIFKEQGFYDKVSLLEQLDQQTYTVYKLNNTYDYFYYNLVPSTGYLQRFDLHHRMPGFILLYPQRDNVEEVPAFIDQPKLANVFHEYEEWGDIIGISNVSELNDVILNNDYSDLIRISEALHEKKVANIADEISKNIEKKRIILIAGPSSSGKTTFAQRLLIHLRVNGLRPVAISTDNYFVNREDTPRDENGNYDFEALEAIDLRLLNRHLIELLQGKEVEVPVFNFQKGKREERGNKLKIDRNQPVIIEGIHGLNDRLTSVIPQDNKFKIYVSALTQLNIDRHNRIPTTDTRLIRRMVRDHYFRGHSAAQTIAWWPNVRKGEEKNIFPFQENADVMFNSALIYELAVLKEYAVPLLQEIKQDEKVYYQAHRLLNLLSCFKDMPEDDVPQTSILREFIGGSCFH